MDPAQTETPDPGVRTTEEEVRPLPILHTLARLHGGRLPDQMQIELAAVVREVTANTQGKGGKLVLELSVDKPNPKMHLTGREIIITASLKKKLPDDPPDAAVFYYDDRGGLHNDDPTQRRMPFGQPST